VSPKGDYIAFLDHPIQGDDSGSVAVVDLSGKKKTLSDGWYSSQGLAWSPDGEEVWFTGNKSGIDRALYAVSLTGKERLVARMPGTLMLLDIWKDGRLLLNRASWRRELTAVADGKARFDRLDYSIQPTFPPTARLYCLTRKVEAAAWRMENPAGLVVPCTSEKQMALPLCF
jgi:hypothetical protein